VRALEAAAGRERKLDAPPGLIGRHAVADRAVPAVGAEAERAVEPHRHRRPLVDGPQAVVIRREGVEQRADRAGLGVEDACVRVVNRHRSDLSIRHRIVMTVR
jgi:hypothetical protein